MTDAVSIGMTQLPEAVARFLGIDTVLRTGVVSEGGGRIHNGEGILLVNRMLERRRNPQKTEAELEDAYKTLLGATRIIWLNAGLYEDVQSDSGPVAYKDDDGKSVLLYGPQTTGGHLDELCQFAAQNRVILAEVSEEEASADPIAAINYERLEEIYRTLSKMTDMNGRPFEIMRIPVPDIKFLLIQPDEPMYKDFLATLDYRENAPAFPLESRCTLSRQQAMRIILSPMAWLSLPDMAIRPRMLQPQAS